MQVAVFYAWQDDRPGKYNRYLIRDAAREACKAITQDPSNEYELSLDEATAGVPGMCDIPNTILDKIRSCSVLLADLTFVGRTEVEEAQKAQLVSNPNVLLEVGYAVRDKHSEASDGFDRVLAVMNTAYGEPNEQMFDTKRRWALRYHLREGAGKAEIERTKRSLTRDIKNALLTICKKAIAVAETESAPQRFDDVRNTFESAVRNGTFHSLCRKEAVITICFVPDGVHIFEYAELKEQQIPPPHTDHSIGWAPEYRGKSVLSVDDLSDASRGETPMRCKIAQLTIEGAIFAADAYLLRPRSDERPSEFRETVPLTQFERLVTWSVTRYGQVLSELGAAPPWRVGISLIGIRGFVMLTPNSRGPKVPHDKEDLVADPVIVRSVEDVSSQRAVGRSFKGTFDYVWREFGADGSPSYDPEGNWEPR